MSEQSESLLHQLELSSLDSTFALTKLEVAESRWIRDSKVNLQNVLKSKYLSEKETAIISVAIAANARNHILLKGLSSKAEKVGASEQEIAESIACASLLSVNNVVYRFRHFVEKDKYNQAPARVKMNIMVKPILGKELFELVSLAVSAVNGCEMCVKSHEQSVLDQGGTEDRIWDAIRLAGVVEGLSKIIY